MSWREKYMKNLVTIETLQKLVKAGRLEQEEVDAMMQERLEEYGY